MQPLQHIGTAQGPSSEGTCFLPEVSSAPGDTPPVDPPGLNSVRLPAGGLPRLVASQLQGHAELTSKHRLAINVQVAAGVGP